MPAGICDSHVQRYTDTHTHTQPIRQTACKMQPNQRNECKKKGNEDQNDDNSETAAAASATITTTSQKQSTTTTTTTTAKNIPFVWLSFCSFLFGFCLLIVFGSIGYSGIFLGFFSSPDIRKNKQTKTKKQAI